jgi:probable HAF family extracellular repeat protein
VGIGTIALVGFTWRQRRKPHDSIFHKHNERGAAMKQWFCGLLAVGLLVGVTGQAMAQPSYSFTTLDVPGPFFFSPSAQGINDSGQIVGSYQDAAGNEHGLLLDQGSYTTLDVPGSKGTTATGINASGQIVGQYQDAAYKVHGFLLDQGSYTTLDVPGATYTQATGINASGQIVGYYGDPVGVHGFLATPVP